MADFTLDQVPGWDRLQRAAALVGVPLVLPPAGGTGSPAPAGTYRWGDAASIRATADGWAGTAGTVRDAAGPHADLVVGGAQLRDRWTGPAADGFFAYQSALVTAHATTAAVFSGASGALRSYADAIDEATADGTRRVLWSGAAVTAAMLVLTTNRQAATLVTDTLRRLLADLTANAGHLHALATTTARALSALLGPDHRAGLDPTAATPRLPTPNPR
jgi:uncharacterized protein YukE